MAQQAVPVRGARLGRAAGATGADATVHGVVLLLPGGQPVSTRRQSPVTTAAARPLARRLAREGRADGLVTHVVRYRYRGWNGAARHPVEDARWAVDEAVRRYGDVPVCLAGTDMGARAALHAADHTAVNSVLALAPWLPQQAQESPAAPEPVRQLAGRHVLLVHGTDDARTDPELSYRLAERAKKVNRDVCRFEVHTDGHGLTQHRAEVLALATDFVLGAVLARGFSRPVADALAAPPPLGLRMPLAAGFGASLRR
ncbi:alpha/beta hydrolase family protein [Streptomyces sp. NPDC001922]|uniref:alpha/beta hydrolase family protein n=1 Tax=Streptomyces sp. NPDC001922 TaxID=3364624 RepID=UPI00369CF9AD